MSGLEGLEIGVSATLSTKGIFPAGFGLWGFEESPIWKFPVGNAKSS